VWRFLVMVKGFEKGGAAFGKGEVLVGGSFEGM